MSVPRCSACGAELIPEANFCRRCGVTVMSASAASASEEPTLTLNERVGDVTTQRLDPRATSPGRVSLSNSIDNSVAAASLRGHAPPSRRKVPLALLGVGVLVITVATISSVAFLRMSSNSRTTDSTALIYPGAATVIDMTSDEGRAIQLQTADSLDRVLAWYDASLKPTKRMRLTSTSFVLRNQNVTATMPPKIAKPTFSSNNQSHLELP